MKLNLIYFASALILGASFTSCKKEGCTDSLASNYDDSADRDDESCLFSANVVFWYDQNTGIFPMDASDVNFYLDSKLLGTSTGYLDRPGIPTCDSLNLVRFIYDMEKTKSGIFPLTIKARSNDSLLYTKTINVSVGKCNIIDIGN